MEVGGFLRRIALIFTILFSINLFAYDSFSNVEDSNDNTFDLNGVALYTMDEKGFVGGSIYFQDSSSFIYSDLMDDNSETLDYDIINGEIHFSDDVDGEQYIKVLSSDEKKINVCFHTTDSECDENSFFYYDLKVALNDSLSILQDYASDDQFANSQDDLSEFFSRLSDVINSENVDLDGVRYWYEKIGAILYPDDNQNDNGDNYDSTISGSISLPSTMQLNTQEECQNSFEECSYVTIDVIDSMGHYLGNTNIYAGENSYNISYRGPAQNETKNITLKIKYISHFSNEEYLIDFGSDKLDNSDDTFIPVTSIKWVDTDNDGLMEPVLENFFPVSAATATIDINMSSINQDKYIVEGTVKLPEDFTPGDIKDSEGNIIGFNIVMITAIDIDATSFENEYRTEITRTEITQGSHTYGFSLPVPNNNHRYIVRISKMSSQSYEEMYLNDGGDHIFGGDSPDVLKSSIGIEWKDNGNGIWIPDVEKTGYFVIDSDKSDVFIDISTYGANFKKIYGTVTTSQDFTIDEKHHMNIEVLEAKTGNYITSSPVVCDGGSCSYSLLLGETVSPDGYIIRINQDFWDEDNWENSWWKGYYYDFGSDHTISSDDKILDEMDVNWVEGDTTQEGYSYYVPNVNPLVITDSTELNISFASYTPPVTYTISGLISNLPSDAKWINVHIYDPISYRGSGTEVKSDGGFKLSNIKEGKYILQISYDKEDNGNYSHYEYMVVYDGSSYSLIDAMEVEWVPFDENGNSLADQAYTANFDWDKVSYWAPNIEGKSVFIDLKSDLDIGSLTIPSVVYYTLQANVSNIDPNTRVDVELFVPNKPIGRWQSTDSDGSGNLSVLIKDLKGSNSSGENYEYQLRLYVEGIGEFWYDAQNDELVSDVYWVGKYSDGTVCEDWKNNKFECDYTKEVIWTPNIQGFNIASDKSINVSLPDNRAKITATLSLGSEYADQYIDMYVWQNTNPYQSAWKGLQADANGNVELSMSVLKGDSYRIEVNIPDMMEGYVVDFSSDGLGGGNDTLITNQNSWKTDGTWGPKESTLIDIQSDMDLGTLTPPSLNVITFSINNLATSEEIFIDMQDKDTGEWYGMGNYNWNDNTYSNTVKLKVPNGNYYVMIHPRLHQSGFINNGNETVDEDISSTTEFTNFDLDWDKADYIAVNSSITYTITLPDLGTLYSFSGSVSGFEGDKTGWISVYSPTAGGNGAMVNSDGTFTVKGLVGASDYLVEYWAWDQGNLYLVQDGVDISQNVTGFSLALSSTTHTLSGSITNSTGSSKTLSALLIDVDDKDNNGIGSGDVWEVLDEVYLDEVSDGSTVNYSFSSLPSPLSGHSYVIAIGEKSVDSTTGATTFNIYNASIDSDNTNTEANTQSVTLDGISSNNNLAISVQEITQ